MTLNFYLFFFNIIENDTCVFIRNFEKKANKYKSYTNSFFESDVHSVQLSQGIRHVSAELIRTLRMNTDDFRSRINCIETRVFLIN